MRELRRWCGAGLVAASAAALAAPSAPTTARRAQGGGAPLPDAREVIRRHVEAVGGERLLRKIQSRYVWARYEFPARQLHGTVEVFTARPDKRIVKVEYPDLGTEITAYDGTTGWTSKPGERPKRLNGAALAQLRDQSQFDFDLHPDSLFRSIATMDVGDFEGRPCYRLRLVSTTGRQWFEYYDVQSGLFAGNVFPQETDGGPVTVKTIVSDYQPIEGIRVPMKLVIRAAGVEEDVKVMRVRENQVDGAVFALPPALRTAPMR
ncbi:MAG TPA: hypothetical protein VJU87_08695 [Gemmatimonadaceae bacterium]|nr:hypothetical protein [Gemmatimonadaceae bacterium]